MRKRTPWEREYLEVWRREQWFLRRYAERPERTLGQKIEALAPEKLTETLRAAFVKAFGVVFEKGGGVIARTGRLPERRQAYQRNEYAAGAGEDRKSLRAFSRAADRAGRGNVALSGTAGVGMGLFGVALPDVPLFTALLLKSVYETAESFGFPWEGEKLYALRVIEAALSYGEELRERNRCLDAFAQTGLWPDSTDLKKQMDATARRLSEALLYGKVLQNVPVAGAVGGVADAVCLSRVQRYAAVKYQKRFLLRRRLEQM